MEEIIKNVIKTWPAFLVLGLILTLGGIFFITSGQSLYRQRLSLIFTAIAYITWGIVHHWQQGDLNLKIVVEYIFMAVIGVSLAYFVVLSQ